MGGKSGAQFSTPPPPPRFYFYFSVGCGCGAFFPLRLSRIGTFVLRNAVFPVGWYRRKRDGRSVMAGVCGKMVLMECANLTFGVAETGSETFRSVAE